MFTMVIKIGPTTTICPRPASLLALVHGGEAVGPAVAASVRERLARLRRLVEEDLRLERLAWTGVQRGVANVYVITFR